MRNIDQAAAATTLSLVNRLALLEGGEVGQVAALFEGGAPLLPAVRAADTMHVHIKVADVARLPHEAIAAGGGAVENAKDGYVKYAFAGGLNVIFSSVDVSEDDVRERGGAPRPRPFLDHVGIDLRRETPEVRAVFDEAPRIAAALGWTHVAQGGEGRAVYCCHTHVSAKHWVYPPEAFCIELALGPLTVDPERSGCDLRPSDPRLQAKPVACCAPAVV